MTKEFHEWMRVRRGIEDLCESCYGFGVKTYANTTPWGQGAGGQVITNDICDNCWGTGDENKKGVNLRHLLRILTTEQKKELNMPF